MFAGTERECLARRRILHEGTIAVVKNGVCAVIAGMMLAMSVSTATWSRQWKTTPDALARDYGTINDTRENGEIVMLMWFVPKVVQPGAVNAGMVVSMLEKYVVLMVLHGRIDKQTGSMSFEEIENLEPRDQNGKPLAAVERGVLPPTNVAMLAMLETAFRQSLGPAGKGMKLFVFEGNGVSSCGNGRLSVPLANETYTWDTPFPGCQ